MIFILPLYQCKGGMGYTGFTLNSAHPSIIHLSVDNVSGIKKKKKLLAQFISYLAVTIMGCVSWPLSICMLLKWISALRWPNICSKFEFPELFEKAIGSIHFMMPGIYPMGWVSWPLFFFVFLASISVLCWPNVWLKMEFSELKKTNFWQNLFDTLVFTIMGSVSWLLLIFVFLPSILVPWGPKYWLKMGFLQFLQNKSAQFISYLAFNLFGCIFSSLLIFVFLLPNAALWCLIFPPKGAFQIFFTLWPSSGRNNARIFFWKQSFLECFPHL